MRKEKSIYNLSPGWLMHRLTLKKTLQNTELFNQICILVSRRLQERKRHYKKPFPDGEYRFSVSLSGTTFDGCIFKESFEDISLLSGNRKQIAVFLIEIQGNNVVFQDLESKGSKLSPITCKEIGIVILKQMGFKILN